MFKIEKKKYVRKIKSIEIDRNIEKSKQIKVRGSLSFIHYTTMFLQ